MSTTRSTRQRKNGEDPPPATAAETRVDEARLDAPHSDGNSNPMFTEYESESEPLSLAEEIAEEVERGISPEETNDRYERIKQGEIHIAELQKMSMGELIEEARKDNVKEVAGMKKQD